MLRLKIYKYNSEIRGNAKEWFSHSKLCIKPFLCSSAAKKKKYGEDCIYVVFVWILLFCKSSMVASMERQL